MAETLTLANLTIDSRGVVSGVEKSDKALARAGTAAQRFGKTLKAQESITAKFGSELFNLRSALTSIAGTIGILAVLSGIAIGLKNVVTELISSTTWFKRSSEAIKDWWGALVKGESTLDRFSRKLKALGLSGGVISQFDELRKLEEQRTELIRTMTAGPGKQRGTMNVLGIPFGIPFLIPGGNPTEALLKAMGFEKTEIERKTDEIFQSIVDKYGLTIQEIEELTGATFRGGVGAAPLDVFAFAGITDPKVLEETLGKATEAMGRLTEMFVKGDLSREEFGVGIENITNKLIALGATEGDLAKIGIALSDALNPEKIRAFEAAMTSMAENLTVSGAAAEAVQTVMAGAANLLAQSLLEGGITMRQALIQIMKDLARMFITYAVMFTGLGIAASTPWGAFLGPPHLFFAAAGKMAIGAALAAGASAALGGRGAGGETATGNVPPGAPGDLGTTRARPLVIVNVDGSILGTSPDELAREMSKLISTAQSDGGR